MSVQALKQALEVLTDKGQLHPDDYKEKKNDAIADLRTAIEQMKKQEPDAIGCKCSVCGEWQRWTPSGMVCKNGHGGVPGINQRLYTTPPAAPVQVPVATYTCGVCGVSMMMETSAAPLQEPVAEVREDMKGGGYVEWLSDDFFVPGTKLYTTPPAAHRQWVSLTDEEIMEVNGIHGDLEEWPEVISEARAIEAKLREKNS